MVLSPLVSSDGDVVGLVEDALVEVGPAGVEEILWGDGFAVEESLIGSEGRDGKAGGLDGGGELEVFAEKRGFGGDAVGADGDGVAIVGEDERCGEGADLLRGLPCGGAGAGLPGGVAGDAAFGIRRVR